MQTETMTLVMRPKIARIEAILSPGVGFWNLRGFMTDGSEYEAPAEFRMTARRKIEEVIEVVQTFESLFGVRFVLVPGSNLSAWCFYTEDEFKQKPAAKRVSPYPDFLWKSILETARPDAS